MKREKGEVLALIAILGGAIGLTVSAFKMGKQEGKLEALEKQNSEKTVVSVDRAPPSAQERGEGKRK